MSIVRQNAIVALFKVQPAGGPTEGEISAYEMGYNSRDEEVASLKELLGALVNYAGEYNCRTPTEERVLDNLIDKARKLIYSK